jgi:hypothetical protein
MMPTENSNVTKSEKNKTMMWRTSKVLLIIASMFGLISLNVLTLVNDDVHAAGYNALKAILTSTVADLTLTRMLSHSPTQKYSVLEKSNRAMESRHAELKRVSGIRAGVAKTISTRIWRRAVTNAVKNVSGFAAEVVPVLGTAAIVALTVSDIYDDCQTLKDLNELNITFEHEKEDETAVCGMKIPSLK